ncbi:50S ribosomal protein L4 [Candidatus Woesearchaeota archaeon]|nr:50S ribosomal protein L4 [Candidatus Woesearchaeota archaeon]
MKIPIKDGKAAKVGEIELPAQFTEPVREDLIAKVFKALATNGRMAYGADVRAGMKYAATLSRRRRKYRGSYGLGISRVPRKILSRRGTRFNWVGAEAPGTVGGRRAHAPTSDKIWEAKINKKENRKAIRSALSATMNAEIVSSRGHVLAPDYPFALSKEFQSVKKTKDLRVCLESLGLTEELTRSAVKKVRAGRGKARGRRYKKRKGVLFVVSEPCDLSKSARNLAGIDIAIADQLNVKDLAPGNHAGRLTLFTEQAVEKIKSKGLFA